MAIKISCHTTCGVAPSPCRLTFWVLPHRDLGGPPWLLGDLRGRERATNSEATWRGFTGEARDAGACSRRAAGRGRGRHRRASRHSGL